MDNDHYFRLITQKKMRFWRIAAFTIAIIAVFILSSLFHNKLSPQSGSFLSKPHIVRINIEGMIIDEEDYIEQIQEISENDDVKGVIIKVNSPGGTTVDSDILYQSLRTLSEKKPTVTHIHNIAASGGYIVSMASDHIIANGNSITGSVGVIMQVPEASELMKKIGVSINEIKTSPLKGEPTPYSPLKGEAKKNIEAMVQDSYVWFLDIVKERRKMSAVNFKKATSGGVFTGRQAVKLGLIDSIGGHKEAFKWLTKTHEIDEDLQIVDFYKPTEEDEMLFSNVFSSLIRYFFDFPIKNKTQSFLLVDGLLSVWHI